MVDGKRVTYEIYEPPHAQEMDKYFESKQRNGMNITWFILASFVLGLISSMFFAIAAPLGLSVLFFFSVSAAFFLLFYFVIFKNVRLSNLEDDTKVEESEAYLLSWLKDRAVEPEHKVLGTKRFKQIAARGYAFDSVVGGRSYYDSYYNSLELFYSNGNYAGKLCGMTDRCYAELRLE